ncbi:MAG: DUF3579 domain-containing protein [Castellaniella sp.]
MSEHTTEHVTEHATDQTAEQLIIFGTTRAGQRFRPSDWAERLAGVLSPFRPEGSTADPLTYSPYAVPRVIDGVRCVVVDHRLRDVAPLAWQFACDFAESNDLKVDDTEGMPADQA